MRCSVRHFVACLLTGSLPFVGAGSSGADDLEVGARAPGFELRGSDGNTYTLSQFVGKRGVVLAWFPKAFTPG